MPGIRGGDRKTRVRNVQLLPIEGCGAEVVRFARRLPRSAPSDSSERPPGCQRPARAEDVDPAGLQNVSLKTATVTRFGGTAGTVFRRANCSRLKTLVHRPRKTGDILVREPERPACTSSSVRARTVLQRCEVLLKVRHRPDRRTRRMSRLVTKGSLLEPDAGHEYGVDVRGSSVPTDRTDSDGSSAWKPLPPTLALILLIIVFGPGILSRVPSPGSRPSSAA